MASIVVTKVVDLIPAGDSAETAQNSEPSLAVDPADPTQVIAGTFGTLTTNDTPFYLSTDGGTAWSNYDDLPTSDKSLAWMPDGSSFLVATLRYSGDISTYSGTISSGGFGTPINTYAPLSPDFLDQPWMRAGPSDHIYVAYNNLNNYGTGAGEGKTASVNVSTDGGVTYTATVIDHVGGAAGQDDPAVRVAVSGSTAYAVYMRWNTTIEDDSNGLRFGSDVVVVRSDNGGADGFTALGSGGDGAEVATTTATFTDSQEDTPLTLGKERIAGGDLSIAIDPNDANHVLVAYPDAPGANGSGVVQVIVAESTDGGVTWTTKFTTSASVRSAQPAVAISSDGTIGLLYNSYDPGTDELSQHLLTTSDDFVTTNDALLATESNASPASQFAPYLGDFFDLEAIGTTFYGIFSASNADNGTDAQFPTATFQRDHTGTPGTSSFQLTNHGGQSVGTSIDPFFFVASEVPCFVRGTLILTDRGEVPVEELAIGAQVVTHSGTVRPIRWIGRRSYDGRFVKDDRAILPVGIAAGALAEGVPTRDLFLSPEHALCIEDVLVPVRHLINGVTIIQAESVDRVEYFHLELDAHDVLFADGAPSESYVDCDNRMMFANGTEFDRLFPQDDHLRWRFCRPRLDGSSDRLSEIRAALLRRAEALGRALTPDPDLHLIADGAIVRSDAADGRVHRFTVPAGSAAVWLASRSVVPAEIDAGSRDIRRLGVPVERLVLRDEDLSIEAWHGHAGLRDGFHPDESSHRWTDGLARFPESLQRCLAGAFTIEVHLVANSLLYKPTAAARARPDDSPSFRRHGAGIEIAATRVGAAGGD